MTCNKLFGFALLALAVCASALAPAAIAAPAVTSIARNDPGPLTYNDSLSWIVTFSEPVTGVDISDFALTSVNGAPSGALWIVTGSGSVYGVRAVNVLGYGTLRLDVHPSGTGITNASGSALAGGFTSGQTYTRVLHSVPVAWGDNGAGQLGNGATTSSSAPVLVTTPEASVCHGIVGMATGGQHSLALTQDGAVLAWGSNEYGQLGDGSFTDRSTPVKISVPGTFFVAIAAGQFHSLALTTDKRVYAWGRGVEGQLGNQTRATSPVPVEVYSAGSLAGKKVVAIAGGYTHSMALAADGRVYAWGDCGGMLGHGTLEGMIPAPTEISGALEGRAIVAVSAGRTHSLALDSSGNVFSWGWNYSGELGNGSNVAASVPIPISTNGALAGKTAVAISAGFDYSLALTSDGQILGWGYNGNGELGDGTTTSRNLPVATVGAGVLAGQSVRAILAGNGHSQALTADGRAFSWGDCQNDRSGNRCLWSEANHTTPVAMGPREDGSALSGRKIEALDAATGHYHSVALASTFAATSVEAPPAGWYRLGAKLEWTVVFPQPVVVADLAAGAPYIRLTTGEAIYQAGSGTNRLVFSHSVREADVYAGRIDFSDAEVYSTGSSLTDAAGNHVENTLPAADNSGIRLGRPPAYATWAEDHFNEEEFADPTISGPQADPDGSGVPNLLRYALGLPGRNAVALSEYVVLDTGVSENAIQLSFPVLDDAPDIAYQVQQSTDLVNWTTVNTYETDGTKRYVTCEVPVPDTARQMFLRLRVEMR